MSLRYLQPTEIRVWRPEGATHLRVEIEGERVILAARVKRAFPTSEPTRFLSIQDAAGEEVGVLSTLEGIDPESYKMIEEELDRRYFTPRIDSIKSLKLEAGMWKFVVGTQRGPTEFYVRNWRDSAIEITPGRWQIHSVDGGRFEIANVEQLDPKSQQLMEQLL